jgi:hypothetical protein
MSQDTAPSDPYELIWEEVRLPYGYYKRTGKSKVTGMLRVKSILDEQGREILRISYDDQGQVRRRRVYKYDEERKPRLKIAYDRLGNIVFRQERGKRPEIFESRDEPNTHEV